MTTRTITATYQDATHVPMTGRVVFRLAQTCTDGTVVYVGAPISVLLDVNGAISVTLQPTSEMTTDNCVYEATEHLNGARPHRYYFELPAGSSVNLATLTPFTSPPGLVYQPALGYETFTALITDGGPSNGTDDTTAINAVLVANPGKVVRLRPGVSYKISAPLVIYAGTTLDARGATVTLLAGSNCNMLTNYAQTQGTGTDAGITILGGAWARGANAGTGNNLHSIFLRRVSHCLVSGITYTASDGKYGISIAQATNFVIEWCTFTTPSDGVHVAGPASGGTIRDISGQTDDDTVAVGNGDYTDYEDTYGDVSDIQIFNVTVTKAANNTTNAVKLFGRAGTVMTRIKIRDVTSTGGGAAPIVGLFPAANQGDAAGTFGTAEIDGVYGSVTTTSDPPAVAVAAVGDTIIVRNVNVKNTNAAGAMYQVQQGALGYTNGGTLGSLTVEAIGTPTVIGTQSIDAGVNVRGTVAHVRVSNAVFPSVAAGFAVLRLGSTAAVVNAEIIGGYLNADSANDRGDFAALTAGCTLEALTITGVSAGRIREAVRGATSVACKIVINGFRATRTSRLVDIFGTTTLTLHGISIDTLTNAMCFTNGGTLTVRGSGIDAGTSTMLQRNAAESVRIVNPDFRVDVSALSQADGDKAYNTNAGLSCGTGVCLSNGSAWKNIYSGATY